MFKFVRSKSVWLILPFYCCFRFLFSEISLRTFCSVWNFQGCITVYLSRCCSSYWKYFQKNFRSCRLRQLIEFIISSSVCQELFSFYFQVSFETWLLITRSNSSLVYQNFLFVSSSFLFFEFLFRNPCCFRFAATVIKYIRTVCRCQALFLFFKEEVPSHFLRWNFSIALSFFSCQPVFAFFLLFYNPVTSG